MDRGLFQKLSAVQNNTGVLKLQTNADFDIRVGLLTLHIQYDIFRDNMCHAKKVINAKYVSPDTPCCKNCPNKECAATVRKCAHRLDIPSRASRVHIPYLPICRSSRYISVKSRVQYPNTLSVLNNLDFSQIAFSWGCPRACPVLFDVQQTPAGNVPIGDLYFQQICL